ncbi:B-cell receptor-associated protein 31-like-domain-containing protein [Gilbertella persicaria]|uniref:B-cell receptor-associated protein 31-like-domain-containing protein n=1 Tax=Gilbertella persicaria TaxID=101096 RepID=UPI0022206EBA|nr:B-cell receptor-associated protein 31-like-domain-containing protein [Gilbertella persicaria]KAI8074283.1 B-cell receptor-associated protein 31-like-domain-containing protein [Gilbertella persicaria]
MTIYYTATFFILVVEMVAFCLLVIPLPSRWRRAILKFASTSPVVARAISTLKIVFGFIFVLFIDAVNRLQRIDQDQPEESHQYHDYSYETSLKARKFYAQRNLYLTGFTLFLSLILERTSTLLIQMLKHDEALEDAKKEHLSSQEDQKRLLEMEKSYETKIESLKKEVFELKQEERDFENLKKQVEQQTAEYHRLADERRRLESSLNEPKKTV